MNRPLLLLAAALVASGCSLYAVKEPPWPEPTPVAPAPERVRAPRQSTSLWADGSPLTGAYDDQRARGIGDVVTVLVVESSEASREASTDLSRDAALDASVGAFLGSSPSALDKAKVQASTANSYKGAGSTKRKDLLRTRVAARVVNVLDDGNLVIEGRRQVQVNTENQYLFVRGIARPTDIAPDNTIASVALADAQIQYGGKGDIANQQRPGWMYRALDYVWPF